MPKRLKKEKVRARKDQTAEIVERLIDYLRKQKIEGFDLSNGYPDGMQYLTWVVASNCAPPFLEIKEALRVFHKLHGVMPTRVGLHYSRREVRMWHPKLVLTLDRMLPDVMNRSEFARALVKRAAKRKEAANA